MEETPPVRDKQKAKPKPGGNGLVKAEKMMEIAFILPSAVVVGWIAGVGMDRWLHQTWIYLAGIILGCVAGFIEVFRLIQSASRD